MHLGANSAWKVVEAATLGDDDLQVPPEESFSPYGPRPPLIF
jgi:hypothetical protein